MAEDYSIGLISEPYVGNLNTVKNIPGLEVHQFPNNNRVKSCIIIKTGIAATLGMSKYSSQNLSIVQIITKGRKLFLVSVYIEPKDDENGTLNRLEAFLRSHEQAHILIGGDFNGWHTSWGSVKSNKRGIEVNNLIITNDLIIGNSGNSPTFETITHGSSRQSIIDLTLLSHKTSQKIKDWEVNPDVCPSCEHKAITFKLNLEEIKICKKKKQSTFKYNTTYTDWSIFDDEMESAMKDNKMTEVNIEALNERQIDKYITETTQIIQRVCDKTCKRKNPFKTYTPWWNSELETLKKEVIKLHHTIHDLNKSGKPIENILIERNELREKYSQLIKSTSTDHFRQFCSKQGKENVWSLTNRLLKNAPQSKPCVTVQLNKTDHTQGTTDTSQTLLNKFYPDDTPNQSNRQKLLTKQINFIPETETDSPFTEEEVLGCLKTMNTNKAPGIDNLTSDICLAFTLKNLSIVTKIMNRCLEISYFPQSWKIAQIIIVPKPNKSDYSDTSSYRPIGLINVFGKLLEKLISTRLKYFLDNSQFSNPFQYGFKEQTSTINALKNAIDIIRTAKYNKQLVIAISLDIQAAFDNAWWPILFSRLKQAKCPQNLYKIIVSYVQDRQVSLNFADTTETKNMSRGCIQGSVCGPLIWNIILDELFEIKLPDGCHLQAFADDILLIVQHKRHADLELSANKALELIYRWGLESKLSFGPDKTKLISFTPKAKAAKIIMNNIQLTYVDEIKLLGVIIDKNLKYIKHVKYIINKALVLFNKLSKYVRPTWGAQPENIRIIYKHVIEPIITYAAGIWGSATKYETVRNQLRSLQRGFALKIIRAFRTVSATAAIALARLTPLHLKVDEVAAMELARITGTAPQLPNDILVDRPVKSCDLLHPAERKSLSHEFANNQEEIDKLCSSEFTQIYTDGSKLSEEKVGAAFIAYKPDGSKIVKKFKLHSSCSVFQAELLAIEKSCLWAVKNKITNLAILSDSLSSLKEIENKDSTNRMVSFIHKYIRILPINSRYKFIWVKAHSGIRGNDEVDEAAKSAAESHRPYDFINFPLSYIKNNIKHTNQILSNDIYSNGTQGEHTRKLCPNLQSIHDLFTVVPPSFELTQILTGHGFHLTYLNRFKIKSTDKCPCDDNTPQTIKHLLEDCPNYEATRFTHISTCDFLKIDNPYTVADIIKYESSTKSFMSHVNKIIRTLKEFNKNVQ